MPCDQQITTSVVELTKVNLERLAAVLKADGWSVRLANGRLRASGPHSASLDVSKKAAKLSTWPGVSADTVLAPIRQAYAARTVAEVSKRFGFRVQATRTTATGAKQLLLKR